MSKSKCKQRQQHNRVHELRIRAVRQGALASELQYWANQLSEGHVRQLLIDSAEALTESSALLRGAAEYGERQHRRLS